MSGPSVCVSAYYSAPVERFLTTEPHHVLGALAAAHSYDLEVEQRQAWEEELLILKEALAALTGTLFLEFDVPRVGSRIDAVLISGPAVFPIEFKCGESHHRLADYNQAWDYALDLKNFHIRLRSRATWAARGPGSEPMLAAQSDTASSPRRKPNDSSRMRSMSA